MLSPIYSACPRPAYNIIGGEDPDNTCTPPFPPFLFYIDRISTTAVLKWRHDVYLECLSPAAELNARNDMEYSDLLAVDARIRTFVARTRQDAIVNCEIDTDTVLRQLAWCDVCTHGG